MLKKMIVVVMLLVTVSGFGEEKKKILYVDSYHEGYAWSDGITKGVESVLKGKVDLKIVRMDTKRNGTDEFKKKAALKAKKTIDDWKPDAVIASDDNAAKYLIEPYYKNKELPFVFCGLNWDASVYGFPCKNVTGMVEVALIQQIIKQLQPFAKGKKIGMIGPDITTARKEEENIEKKFNLKIEAYYAKNYEDWKKGFVEIQKKCDILIIASDGGLYDKHKKELQKYVIDNTVVPTGAAYDFMAPYALVTLAKVAEEQGVFAATAALDIATGKKTVKQIPVVANKQGKMFINVAIMKKLKAAIPFSVLMKAEKIDPLKPKKATKEKPVKE